MTGDNVSIVSNNLNIDKNGNILIENDGGTPSFVIKDYSGSTIEAYGSNLIMTYNYLDNTISQYLQKGGYYVENESTGQSTTVWYNGIITPVVNQTSLESIKKNISIYNENALETILNSDIYTYNLKTEKDTDKKHIGFVIGDKYRTPKQVINNEQNAIELYSAIGILWKAMQEQNQKQKQEIEQLKQDIEKLKKGEKYNGIFTI